MPQYLFFRKTDKKECLLCEAEYNVTVRLSEGRYTKTLRKMGLHGAKNYWCSHYCIKIWHSVVTVTLKPNLFEHKVMRKQKTMLRCKCKDLVVISAARFYYKILHWEVSFERLSLAIPYLYSGKWFNDSDEVLLQQVVIQLGQVSVDNWVIPQFCFVLC